MAFVVAYGIPRDTSQEKLSALHREITDALAKAFEVSRKSCHPFFPTDMLEEEPDADSMIYVRIDTSLFKGRTPVFIQNVAGKIAHVIWDAFKGQYGVEVFPLVLAGETKALMIGK